MKNITLVRLNKIETNKYQPREHFEENAISELADSIDKNGLIQPITVRKIDDHYEIIAGERRFRALNLLGYKEAPCIVIEADDMQSANMALVENIQRSNLSAIEEARAYNNILNTTNIKQIDLAKQMGKSQASVANKLRLLTLPKNIQSMVIDKAITERHARALLSVDKDKVDNVAEYIVKKQLNVAQAESYIKELNNQDNKKPTKNKIKGISKNIQLGINTIKKAQDMCTNAGIKSELSISESDTNVVVTVKFSKEGS